jgi:HAD superfamily hydrolase (TIGR01509 family)
MKMNLIQDFLETIKEVVTTAVFDFDGVIADTEPLHAESYVRLLRRHGVTFSRSDFKRYMGNDEHTIFTHLEEDFHIAFDHKEESELRKMDFLNLLHDTNLKPSQQTLALLEVLKQRGVRTFILSSQDEDLLEDLLKQWGIRGYFEDVVTIPRDVLSKREALHTTELLFQDQPQMIVIVEDSHKVLEEAKELGLHTIAVSHELNYVEEGGFDFVYRI